MSNYVRCKFSVNSLSHQMGIDPLNLDKHKVVSLHVRMNPVYGDCPENKQIWQATPSGSLELFINNLAVDGFFKIGKSYYIDITEAAQ